MLAVGKKDLRFSSLFSASLLFSVFYLFFFSMVSQIFSSAKTRCFKTGEKTQGLLKKVRSLVASAGSVLNKRFWGDEKTSKICGEKLVFSEVLGSEFQGGWGFWGFRKTSINMLLTSFDQRKSKKKRISITFLGKKSTNKKKHPF